MDHRKGTVNDVEGVRSLGGREMLNFMRDGICFYVMVVVVVLMVAAGMVVLVIVVGVLCTGSGIGGLYRSG